MTETIQYPMQSETIGKLALALSKAQGQMDSASKSSDNPFFKSKYADLHECIQAAKKPLSDNELAVIQTTEPSETGINIITTLAHSSGEWIRGILDMKPKKDDDQGRGSSITYGRRYSFAAIVGIAQKDDDGNASSSRGKKEPVKKGKGVAEWEQEADKNNSTVQALESWYKRNAKEIGTLSAADQTKVIGYLGALKELIVEQSVLCPDTSNMSTEDQCKNSKCSSTFDKCKGSKLTMDI